jgi:hypothetical protein
LNPFGWFGQFFSQGSPPPRPAAPIERTDWFFNQMHPNQVKQIYGGIHGLAGNEFYGARQGPASYVPRDLPDEHVSNGMRLVQQMFPNPPPTVRSDEGTFFNRDSGQVHLGEYAPPSAIAHEFEHAHQFASPTRDMGSQLALHAAAEYGPAIQNHLFPQASYQSFNPAILARQRHDLQMSFGPDYSRDMTWAHNQAQRYGVFGPTPISQALGYKGQGAHSITDLIASNPQWLRMATGQMASSQQAKPAAKPFFDRYTLGKPTAPKAGKPIPDLTGYLP